MIMEKEYDFTKAKKNPYVGKLKQQITINIDKDTVAYFKTLSQDTGVPYQTLINLFLTDCAKNRKRLSMHWQ